MSAKIGRPAWPDAQVDFLRAHIRTTSATWIAAVMGRSRQAVYAKAASLGLFVGPGRKPDKRRADFARKFGIVGTQASKLLTNRCMAQLDACADDSCRRLLLGVSEQFEEPQAFAPMGMSPAVAERVKARAA